MLWTFIALNTNHLRFFSWDPRTCIWIKLIPIILDILCIRSNVFIFRGFYIPTSDPGWSLLTRVYFIPVCFQIVHMSSQWDLMHHRPKHMDLFYLINWSFDEFFVLLTSLALNDPSCSFFSWIQITCTWIDFVPVILYVFCIRSNLFISDVLDPNFR